MSKAQSPLDELLPLVLKHEGGYVDHPKDPGGRTNRGVTQRTYDAFRDKQKEPRQHVRYLTDSELRSIYRDGYWNPINGDHMPLGIAYVTFDAAVNSGVSRGAKWTQAAVEVDQDGRIGPKTLAKIAALDEAGRVNVIKTAARLRLGFLHGLSHWGTFGKGWTRRVHEVEAAALRMTTDAVVLEREAAESRKASKREVSGGVSSGLGAGGATQIDQIPDIVLYGLAGLALLLVVVLVRRALSHAERARMLERATHIVESTDA